MKTWWNWLDISNQLHHLSRRLELRAICTIRLWNIDSEELKGANGLNQEILHMLEKDLALEFSLAERLQQDYQVKL